jgi:hypothetical protein
MVGFVMVGLMLLGAGTASSFADVTYDNARILYWSSSIH